VVDLSMDLLGRLRRQLSRAEPDLRREMVRAFAEPMTGAAAQILCGAGCRQRSNERTERRNDHRSRPLNARVSRIAPQVPKHRSCS
jgi:putative transposase